MAWMQNTYNKVAMSIDVEDWYHSRHITSMCSNPNEQVKSFRRQYDRSYHLLDKPISYLLELFQTHQIKATFFIVADLIKENQYWLRKIVNDGHELACHDLHHIEYVGDGAEAEAALFKSNVGQAKQMLEDFSGRSVTGFRAPSAYFRPWMTEYLSELGFKYDSSVSINSLYSKVALDKTIGGTAPFQLGGPSGLIELPWPVLSVGGFKIPVGGGPVMRYFGGHVMVTGLKQSLRKGDSVFYCHPLDVTTEALPDIITSQRRRFWLGKGIRAQKALSIVLASFDTGTFVQCQNICERFEMHRKKRISV